ncbi:MAG: hypothetical protein SOZ95_04470 [Bacilli bacterium]|nr:hypothetical protein [Bacilli bacterium]
MIKNVEELKKYRVDKIEIIVNRMNLFELSNLYNIVKKSLSSLNTYINDNYEYKCGMSKEDIIEMERNYSFVMENVNKYEKIMGIILNEIDIRNVENRFNVSI